MSVFTIVLITYALGVWPSARRLAYRAYPAQRSKWGTERLARREAITIGCIMAVFWPIMWAGILVVDHSGEFMLPPRSERKAAKLKEKEQRIRELEAQLNA